MIDAKDPLAGALGAVSADVLREIHATVAGACPVTAAIGDAVDEIETQRTAATFAAAGAALVKVGFAGITSARRIEGLIQAPPSAALELVDQSSKPGIPHPFVRGVRLQADQSG